MKHKRKRKKAEYRDIELNIMPFIDVFSMLNTFLLFSAVFISIGIIEVQIPFLSNSPTDDKEKPARIMKVNVDIGKEKILLETSYTAPPENTEKSEFPNNPQGHNDLHNKLVKIRQASPDTDKATVFTDDEVLWENISVVLDSIMLRRNADPVFPPAKDEKNLQKAEANSKVYVYPKIVMGSVMLR